MSVRENEITITIMVDGVNAYWNIRCDDYWAFEYGFAVNRRLLHEWRQDGRDWRPILMLV